MAYEIHGLSVDLDEQKLYFIDRWASHNDFAVEHEDKLRQFSVNVSDVPPGNYRLMAILYNAQTGERVPWIDNPGYVPEMLNLGEDCAGLKQRVRRKRARSSPARNERIVSLTQYPPRQHNMIAVNHLTKGHDEDSLHAHRLMSAETGSACLRLGARAEAVAEFPSEPRGETASDRRSSLLR